MERGEINVLLSPSNLSSRENNTIFGATTTNEPNHDLPFTYGAVIFSAVMLIPMAVFGLLANLITMIVISKSKTLKQTWGFDYWAWPKVLCKASFAVDAWTTYVTTIHILLFAILRLISIQWPIVYKKISVLQVRMIIVCVWLVGFGCGFMPYAIMFEDIVRNRNSNTPDAAWSHCSLNPAWYVCALLRGIVLIHITYFTYFRMNQFIAYYQIAYPIFIYFPMAAIIVLCPSIGIIIKRRRVRYRAAQTDKKDAENHRRRKERNAFLQLGFITGSFLMGYIPNTAHVVYTTNVAPESMSMRVLEWNLFMMGYICLRLSECLNPIFYNLVSSKMRKETFRFLRQRNNCPSELQQPTPPQSNGSTAQTAAV